MDKTIVDVYNAELDAYGRMPRSALRHRPDWEEVQSEPEHAALVIPADERPRRRRRRPKSGDRVPASTVVGDTGSSSGAHIPLELRTPTDSDAPGVEVPAEPVEQPDAPGTEYQRVTPEES